MGASAHGSQSLSMLFLRLMCRHSQWTHFAFSTRRLKAYLFTLVGEFEFELGVPPEEIIPVGSLLQRPNMRSESEKGAQLPLIIRPFVRD